MQRSDFRAILRTLREHDVQFIVVGGVAVVLLGAPFNTFDLDIVHSTEESKIARLLAVLDELEAAYRAQPERRLRSDRSDLSSQGHQLLATRYGPLDLLGMVGARQRYEDLYAHTIEMDAGQGVHVRVLSLEKLIEIKEQTAGEKDLAVLPILRRTLQERNRR